ncbi:MAG: hypothetical protein AAGI06_19900, partial [Pseudomonadota bacterium]
MFADLEPWVPDNVTKAEPTKSDPRLTVPNPTPSQIEAWLLHFAQSEMVESTTHSAAEIAENQEVR